MGTRFPIRDAASSRTRLRQERRVAAGGGGIDADVALVRDVRAVGLRGDQRQDRPLAARQRLRQGPRGGRVAPPQDAREPRERGERGGVEPPRQGYGAAAERLDRLPLRLRRGAAGAEAEERRAGMEGEAV